MKKIYVLSIFIIFNLNAYSIKDTLYILPTYDFQIKEIVLTDTITGNSIVINRKKQWPYRNNILVFDTSATVLEMKIKKRFSRKYLVLYLPMKGEKAYLNYSSTNKYLHFTIRKLKILYLCFWNKFWGTF